MRKLTVMVIVVGIAVLFAGCTPWKHARTDAGRVVHTENFRFAVPNGWSYKTTQKDLRRDALEFTREGPAIQGVRAHWVFWDQPMSYPDREVIPSGSLMPDIARRYIAARQRQLGAEPDTALSVHPAEFAGASAFKAEYRYRLSQGVNYRGVVIGMPTEFGVYFLTYEAPEIHFFERDRGGFEAIAAAVKKR